MSEDAPDYESPPGDYCRLCDETGCDCRKYLSQTLRAMERLDEVGEITITDAPERGETDARLHYKVLMRDFFIATGIHWKHKE